MHIRAVERSGLRGLVEGQKVSYEVQADRRTGKEAATNQAPVVRSMTWPEPMRCSLSLRPRR